MVFTSLPFYAQPWWWDITCGEAQWHVHKSDINSKGDVLFIPARKVISKGLNAWVQPTFTQYTPFIFWNPKNGFELNKTSLFNKATQVKVLSSIAKDPIIEINLPPNFAAGIGFKWAGFDLYQRYTFAIEFNAEKNFQNVQNKYATNLKRNLQKAESAYIIEEGSDAKEVFSLLSRSIEKQGGKLNCDEALIKKIMGGLKTNKCGQTLVAKDKNNVSVGAIVFSWDQKSGYYLIGGQEVAKGAASAHSLLLNKAIEKCYSMQLNFDFCGSMMEGVARFFASFGAEAQPFSSAVKYSGAGKLKMLKNKLF